MRMLYNLEDSLVGDRREMREEVNVSDLEYVMTHTQLATSNFQNGTYVEMITSHSYSL